MDDDKVSLLDCTMLIPIFHDFLSNLIEDCDPEAPLKTYLTYAAEIDLDGLEWFVDHFPDHLQVRHTLAVFNRLQECNITSKKT